MVTCRMRDDNLMEIKVEGLLTERDYKNVLPELDKRLRRSEGLKFLVILENFKGWEPAALWDDIKFDIKNRKRFGNIAVLGEKDSHRWMTKMSNYLFASEVKFFRKDELMEAMSWLKPEGPFREERV